MNSETTAGKIGLGIFGAALVFCSMEMSPGWGLLNLDWPWFFYYAIIMVAGVVSGVLVGGRYIVPAVAGYLVGGPGALLAIGVLLMNVDTAYSVILLIVGLIGALPGVGLFFLLKLLQDAIFPPEKFDPPRPTKPPQQPGGF